MRARLAVGVILLVAWGTPVLVHRDRVARATAEARHVAAEVAGAIARRARRHPRLWRYEGTKLLDDIRSYRSGVLGIGVPEAGGPWIGPATIPDDALVVDSAIVVAGARIGTARVAVGVDVLVRGSLLVLLLCSAVGLALAILVVRLQRGRQRLASLSQRARQAQLQERRAIARELHDGTGQALTAARIQLELVRDLAAPVEEAIGHVDQAVEEVRRAVDRLGPSILDEESLPRALAALVRSFEQQLAIRIALEVPDDLEPPPSVALALYRTTQEALTNVARHAEAGEASVTVIRARDSVTLRVTDDGRGFRPSVVTERGLAGVRERLELLDGELHVRTAPSHGVDLEARLPLDVV